MGIAQIWTKISPITVILVVFPLSFSACSSLDVGDGMLGMNSSPSTVRSLARDIDQLEEHIERYGSVTAKSPDVWGQARLTKIRNEFEQQMAVELTKFTTTLQGSSFASDQAYFVNAMALSAAASGTQQYVRPPRTVVNNSTTTATQQTETTPPGTAISPATLPVISSTDNTFGAFTSLNRNNATLPAALPFNVVGGINLEPNVVLEQKARYLNALHELRRINEGDDTADSPGYSWNLIRIPVSSLPGTQTDIGYAAENT
ncbi:MAG: hypothetical protein JWM11_6830, partial [Planctomycetaceae bacterium]|nr:hypothetical protein [Planctomycetaceae bacterium]